MGSTLGCPLYLSGKWPAYGCALIQERLLIFGPQLGRSRAGDLALGEVCRRTSE